MVEERSVPDPLAFNQSVTCTGATVYEPAYDDYFRQLGSTPSQQN